VGFLLNKVERSAYNSVTGKTAKKKKAAKVRAYNAAVRTQAATQRAQVANLHAIWPEVWKLSQRTARAFCQQNPGSEYKATADTFFETLSEAATQGRRIAQLSTIAAAVLR
jgi:hypothetical protein